MKIDAPKSTSGTRALKHLKGARRSSPFSGHMESPLLADVQEQVAAAPLQMTHDILALQEKRPETPQQRGEKMLNALERLHTDLLMGHHAAPGLNALSQTLQTHTQHCEDPKLQRILGQIEQRVAIELAKRGRNA